MDDACLYFPHLIILFIYGFDVIAGKNKMTGAFHDFSIVRFSIAHDTRLLRKCRTFCIESFRELPEWARNIFQENAWFGNVQNRRRSYRNYTNCTKQSSHAYFEEVGETKGEGAPDLVAPCPKLLL